MSKDNIKIVNPEIEAYRSIACVPTKRPKIGKMFQLLGYTPHKGQQEIIDAMDNHYMDYYFWIMIISRRWGKSFFTSLLAVTDLVIPFASVLIIAPVSKQAGIIYNQVVKFIKQLGIGFEKINNNEMTFTLENGSTCIVGNETNLENSEGRMLSTVILEESGLFKDIEKVLGSLLPSIASYGLFEETKQPVSRVIINGTFKGNKYHRSLYLKGVNSEDTYMSFRQPSSMNPMVTKEFLKSQKELLPEAIYLREYEASVDVISGGEVFSEFNRKTNLIKADVLAPIIRNDKDAFIIAGLDVGATDESAYVLVKVENGTYYVFAFWAESGNDEEAIANKVKALENEWGIIPEIRFIDPSAKITSLGLANTYDLPFYPGKNNIKEGIALLNQLFRNKKLYISDDLMKLVEQIESIEYKETTVKSGDPFKRVAGHHFDLVHALRYAVYTHYKQYNGGEITTL